MKAQSMWLLPLALRELWQREQTRRVSPPRTEDARPSFEWSVAADPSTHELLTVISVYAGRIG